MSEWKHKLDISTPFQKALNGEMDIGELTTATLSVINNLKSKITDEYMLEWLDEIILYFEDVFTIEAEEPIEFVERDRQELYDNAMEALYDWGDTTIGCNDSMDIKMCWINTS